MKLIAHRGLTDGPDKQSENHPQTIQKALSEGFDCEIDIWVEDGNIYLGHDNPTHKVTEDFINQAGLWLHAKSFKTLTWLASSQKLNYFWHQDDDYTLTSKGFIWAYPGMAVDERCVMVMPEWNDPKLSMVKNLNCYAVCSDYVRSLR